jgi:hypothetical protein
VAVKHVLLATALAIAGCASLPPCPGRGGPAWSELRSEHFDLMTDLDAADARAALRGFEELRAAVMLAAWRRAPEPPGRIVVFVLRDDAERRVFVPPRALAAFVSNLPLGQSFLVKSGNQRDDVVTESLVYAIAHRYGLQGKARWFDVGVAEYLGSLRLDDGGKLTYGEVDQRWYAAVNRGGLTSFENLWKPTDPETEWRFAATSWLVVHYLFNQEGVRFAQFQRRLIEADARAAWNEVFPELTPEKMDERLSAYLFVGGTYSAFETHVPPVAYEATVTPLGDARVHALRALLYATTPAVPREQQPALVHAEVAESLRLDDHDALAIYVQRLWLHEDERDLTVPRALVARQPENAFGWLVLAHTHKVRHEAAEAEAATRQLRALVSPETPVGLDLRVARPD